LKIIFIFSFVYIVYKNAIVVDNGTEITAISQVFIKSNKIISFEDTKTIGIFIAKETLSTYKVTLKLIIYLYTKNKVTFLT